jgi:hypothetical protein
MAKPAKKLKLAVVPKELKLDLGTGTGASKPEGFVGVDIYAGKGVDTVCDLRQTWPWKTDSVDEAQANHLIEYLTPMGRVHFVNELHRVLKVGSKATFWTPHWCSNRAYGDLQRQWPPVSEDWLPFLSKAWREQWTPHGLPYTCDFDFTLGYSMHPGIGPRNQEYQQHALTFWKEAAQDMICTLTKR